MTRWRRWVRAGRRLVVAVAKLALADCRRPGTFDRLRALGPRHRAWARREAGRARALAYVRAVGLGFVARYRDDAVGWRAVTRAARARAECN